MCHILMCFVAKVKTVAIVRFYFNFLAFYDYLWRFMVLFGTFVALYGTFWHFWPVTLFCGEFIFIAIYELYQVK